jgi:hypothetical protein
MIHHPLVVNEGRTIRDPCPSLYLFCSRLARGIKYLKNNQYPDLFFFCLTIWLRGASGIDRGRFLVSIRRIAALIASL